VTLPNSHHPLGISIYITDRISGASPIQIAKTDNPRTSIRYVVTNLSTELF